MAYKPGQSGNLSGRPKSTATMAKAYAPNALLALREIVQSQDVSAGVRYCAAQAILDAACNKQPQIFNLTEEHS